MPKDEVHHWLRTAVLLAGIIFAGGGYAMKINSNSNEIKEAKEKIENVRDSVHNIELKQVDLAHIAERTQCALSSIESKVDGIQKEITQIKTIQAVSNEKLLTLTKDE